MLCQSDRSGSLGAGTIDLDRDQWNDIVHNAADLDRPQNVDSGPALLSRRQKNHILARVTRHRANRRSSARSFSLLWL